MPSVTIYNVNSRENEKRKKNRETVSVVYWRDQERKEKVL